jgi:Tfp pilus assembly protein PilO
MMQDPVVQVRLAWMAVALTALLGLVAVVLPGQRRIAAIEARSSDLADDASRNEALIARLDSLEQTRLRVRRDLDRLAGHVGGGKAMVAALHVLENEAGRNHLSISSIAPAAEQPVASHPTGEEDITVTLRGRYRDVMNAIADAPRHDALLEVRSIALARVDTRGLFPSVDATVGVALYHAVADLIKEDTHAQTVAH